MRKFELYNGPTYQALKVLRGIVEISPQAVGYEGMRQRMKLLDRFDEAEKSNDGYCVVEDAEWENLVAMIDGPCANIIKRETFVILTKVKEAELVTVAHNQTRKVSNASDRK